ncbi:MAG: PilZ domain-containing protein [Pseudomonadota bacterium]|nr:MAG: PilZ domain-containing protein [Pseudomonadota bacterium]
MKKYSERRRFHRFPFDARCELVVAGQRHLCDLLDISINGALIEPVGDLDLPTGDGRLLLEVRGELAGDEIAFSVVVDVVRLESMRMACRFVEVDVDSFESLKDLVADNLGDLELLDRELTQLDYWPGLAPARAVG